MGTRHQEATRGERSGHGDEVCVLVELWYEHAAKVCTHGNSGS
jgi:hypothetical protein